jgi:hypothetical protein
MWTLGLLSAFVIPASLSAQSIGAGSVTIREFIDDVTTVLAEDVGEGVDVAVDVNSGVGIDGIASATAFASVANVSFPPPGTLPGPNIAYGGIDIGASTSVDGNTTTPPTPNVQISTRADVFWGQEWLLTGGTGPGPHLVDVVLDVSGTLDVAGAGLFTDIVAIIDFGLVFDEPGIGPDFGALAEAIICQAGGGIGDCFFFGGQVDSSHLTITPGFDTVTVFGQIVISGLSGLPLDTPFLAGPRLTLTILDDLSTTLGLDPAVADFSGSVRFALSPQEADVSIVAVPEPGAGPLGLVVLLAVWCVRRLR